MYVEVGGEEGKGWREEVNIDDEPLWFLSPARFPYIYIFFITDFRMLPFLAPH